MAAVIITGVCKLCGNTEVLRESHILPKHAYKQAILHNAHPRTKIVQALPGGTEVDDKRQDGFKEHLLCDTCEGKLSKWETYACRKLFNRPLPSASIISGKIELTGIEYQPIKLYLLSLLWRAGVANSNFFKCVKLGPHADRLRKMLLAEDPGDPRDYGCLLMKLEQWKEFPVEGVVFEPFCFRSDGEHSTMFAFMGLAIHFFFSSRRTHLDLVKCFPDRSGTLKIIPIRIDKLDLLFHNWLKMIAAVQSYQEEP